MLIRLAIVVGFVAVLGASVLLPTYGVQHIDQWERSHGYPYGKMCKSIFTLYKDTCR